MTRFPLGLAGVLCDQFITATITLEPGDLIATGTPAGVGIHRKPPVSLKPGDEISVGIESIGVLTNPVLAE